MDKQTNKVTAEQLMKMNRGATKVFQLPDVRACRNGASLAWQYQKIFNCTFKTAIDRDACILTITKI